MTLTCCGLLLTMLGAAPYTHDPNVPEELRVRDGLPNVMAKLNAGQTVRIAYLGGSITAANGWRPKTLAWFRQQWPNAKVEEINAAISGTGSDYSACRLQGDVMAKGPDLVFLECRVNGGGGYEHKSVEGVVRQVWRTNPRCDLCFVYTIHQGMMKDMQAGKARWFTPIMETIANAYGIPTIDLGVEIAKREAAGSLIFRAPGPVEGKLVFSHDGVHPGDEGHEIYKDVIARSILAMKALAAPCDHKVLATPLQPNPWEATALVPIDQVTHSAGWVPVDPKTDPVYRDDIGRTDAMLRGAIKTDRAGESITVKWTGTTVGLSDIPYGEPVIIEAVVDGKPIELKRTQNEASHKYARFVYLPEQPAGPHTAVFTVKTLPAGQSVYLGHVLVVGTPEK